MTRYTPNGTVTTIPAINAELEAISQAFEGMFSRLGESPNQLETDIDANGNKILNVKTDPADPQSLVSRGDIFTKEEAVQKDNETLQAAKQFAASLSDLRVSDLSTTSALINGNPLGLPLGSIVNVDGFTSTGDGGTASWIKIGEGATASQSPADTLNGTATTPEGDVYKLVEGQWVTPEMLGAVGDGVVDDGLVIRSLFAGYKKIWLRNIYFCNSPFYDATANWRYHAALSDNTSVIGKGTIKCFTPFAVRAVALLVRGSNVSIDGITVEDSFNAASPFLVGVGVGSAYDSTFNKDLRNLHVTNCKFNNNWLSVTVQLLTGTGSVRRVNVEHCHSINLITSGSGGNYNFRAPLNEYPISDINVSFCTAENGTTASSYNFFSVRDFKVVGCSSKFNRYAGTEAENGSRNGQIIGFTSYDDCFGVWIDDSKDIQVTQLIHETVTSNYVTPLLGTLGLVRNAVRITRQGFQGNELFQSTNIQVNGVVSKNGSFFSGTFGNSPQGSIGRFAIINWLSRGDGLSGTTGFSAGGGYEAMTLRNIDVAGFTSKCVTVAGSAGSVTFIDDVKTFNVASEASLGLEFAGTGKLFLDGAYVQSESIVTLNNEIRSLFVNGVLEKERINNQVFLYGFTGSPEGVVEAGTGSVVYREDDGAIYVKGSGVGNTGWLRVATV